MRKCLKETLPSKVPASDKKSMIVIDFMAYARKVPVKTLKLKTYEDFGSQLWGTFSRLSENSD